jgi:hypothetical protein
VNTPSSKSAMRCRVADRFKSCSFQAAELANAGTVAEYEGSYKWWATCEALPAIP